MKKRILSFALALLIAAALPLSVYSAVFPKIDKTRSFEDRQFSDVPDNAWYYKYVSLAYEYAIIDGVGGSMFAPEGKITVAEAIKLAACLHKGYNTGSASFQSSAQGAPWYTPYVDYALKNGIISEAHVNYNAPITRADFAVIFANALPEEAVTPLNHVVNGAIPDVMENYSYGSAVYMLYRAGVLTGSDSAGTFYPGRSILRSEASAIIARMLDADLRKTLFVSKPLTPEEIYKTCEPATFFVEVFDSEGELIKTGSGFFITEDGLAVTNYHVLNGGYSAKITVPDGTVYDVSGIYDYHWKKDIALIKIDGEGFPCLEQGDSDNISTGASVYAIGSPLGLQSSFTKGIISSAQRFIEGVEYIQIDVSISHGSSGGALLDASGNVIGITSATTEGGQNVNLAVPINLIASLSRESFVPLESLLPDTVYYEDYYPVPDFGALSGAEPFSEDIGDEYLEYSYLLSDMPEDSSVMFDRYKELLEQNLFALYGYFTRDDSTLTAYYNTRYNLMVAFGIEKIDDLDCITVYVG